MKENKICRDKIIVRGARVNNLKNIDVDIPRNKLVVITGLSGSGKSSLAFDLIYAEGNRRYLEGMSSYARQFLDITAKPDFDKIENLSPTISIDQKSLNRNSRSTVGTLTEIYDYLRVFFAKLGAPHCPSCGTLMNKTSNQEILDKILSFPEKSQVAILAEVKNKNNIKNQTSREILRGISQQGFARVRADGKFKLVNEIADAQPEIEFQEISIVVDRIQIDKKNIDRERILDSLETAMKIGKGFIVITFDQEKDFYFNRDFVCLQCRETMGEITPSCFSFNSPEGACEYCSGLGVTMEIDRGRVIPNPNLTLAEGAIMPWNKSNGRLGSQNGYLNVLEILGRKYGFSIHQPVKSISPAGLEIIFGGTPQNQPDEKWESFAGVIALMKKRYTEANSDFTRSEMEKYMLEKTCPSCLGKRLKKKYLSVLVGGKSIDQVVDLDLVKFTQCLQEKNLIGRNFSEKEISEPLIKEMALKAQALINVGLEYLSLSRGANSLSGGEAQRIRLATQIGSELMGVTYVLDEPSIGLHNRDMDKLVGTMQVLKDNGNSLLVVEHDESVIRKADWIIDLGPGAGEGGGEIIFEGDLKSLLSSKTATADYLNGKKSVSEKKKYRKGSGKNMEILGADENNLRSLDVVIPLGKFVAVTGVSGSGKSSLVNDILAKALAQHFFNAKAVPGKYKKIKGLNHIDKVINIDQAPIGRTPRSNAATYTGVFSLIRDLFASTEEAVKRNYTSSRFSFNMRGGRCEVCQGDGTKKIEMHLMPDMYIRCEACQGARYNQKTLEIEYQGVNICEVLDMSVSYALRFFKKSYLIVEKLRTLEEVGLGYLKLGQSATNLSGGEAQRIKLATELSRKSTGKTLYILDEPTIGLHFEDIKRLLKVLDALVDRGNSVLVVEHNIDVVKNADWVIDLGPDGGDKGGELVYAGTPDKLPKCKRSWTGKYL
jgi:excinuclease ABC subunit A